MKNNESTTLSELIETIRQALADDGIEKITIRYDKVGDVSAFEADMIKREPIEEIVNRVVNEPSRRT